ncbi:Protein cornichon homolog 4 [Linum grandiflorum]
MWSLYGWLFNFVFLIAVLAIVGFELMCLADLEFDHINPYDSARRINMVVFPEYITQAAMCLSFLLTGHWVFCILSLPYLYFNLTLYLQRRHMVDVTEIYNQLNREKMQRLYKLFYLVLLCALSLICSARSLINRKQ